MGHPHPYLIGVLHNPKLLPDKLSEPPNPKALWSNSIFYRSDGHASCTNLIRLDATSVIPPRAAPFLLGTSAWVLRPKSENRPPVVLWLKPPNPLASSVLHTHPPLLDTCHRRPRPLGRQVLQSLRSTCTSAILTRSTRSLLHVHLRLSMSLGVSHRCWFFGALVPQSKPRVHPSLLLVHRHGPSLLDLHLAIDHRLRAPHLRTTSQETYCTTSLTITHHSETT